MKNKIIIISFLLLSFCSFAQDWKLDFKEAQKNSAEKDLPIILVFQGSDWCAPCIKLDRNVWSTTEFKNYAENHFVMLQADFPKRSKNALPKDQQAKNDQLAEKYNPNGYFPFVVILDKTGKVLGQTGYKNMSPKEYIDHLNSFLKNAEKTVSLHLSKYWCSSLFATNIQANAQINGQPF
ncbi:thioredoxin family protein [Mesonia mobilis]|uniref:thioredoxin family protein n=1 Tax=Mesonia mobilis TaxID=369791 RepID=UPI003216B069